MIPQQYNYILPTQNESSQINNSFGHYQYLPQTPNLIYNTSGSMDIIPSTPSTMQSQKTFPHEDLRKADEVIDQGFDTLKDKVFRDQPHKTFLKETPHLDIDIVLQRIKNESNYRLSLMKSRMRICNKDFK